MSTFRVSLHLLTSGPGEHASILEGYLQSKPRYESTSNPQTKRQTNAANRFYDDSWGSEDATPNNSGYDQNIHAAPSQVPPLDGSLWQNIILSGSV
jgi:hypothetical protein